MADQKRIKQIEDKIDSLDGEKNVGKKMKTYEETKKSIAELSEKVKQAKIDFESIKKETIGEKINDNIFEEYMKNINNINNIDKDDFTKLPLDDLINKYKKLIEKIRSCEKYLRDKKMEIIYHDKTNDDKTDDDNSSSS